MYLNTQEKLTILQDKFLNTHLGQNLLYHEQLFYHNTTKYIFANTAVQLGLYKINLINNSNMYCTQIKLGQNIITHYESLPFKNDSIDLIICPHIIEYMSNYIFLLQECHRILHPNGKLLITSFNNLSPLSIFHSNILKNAHLVPLVLLKEQLIKLNFYIESGKFIDYSIPINNEFILNKLAWVNKVGDRWFPTLANIYALSATKLVTNMDLILDNNANKKLRLTPQFGHFIKNHAK